MDNTENNTSDREQEFHKKLFEQAYTQTINALDKFKNDPLTALTKTFVGRNSAIDQLVDHYAKAGKAECGRGCSACCYQMVACAPFEILWIASVLLENNASYIEELKIKLDRLAALPLKPEARYSTDTPCALLKDSECSIYKFRPRVCRTHLSASRAACDASLAALGEGQIPYIADQMKAGAALQLGIDYALNSCLNVNIENVELSKALRIALNDLPGTLSAWLAGEDPFAGCQIRKPGLPSYQEMANSAADRFGIKKR